MLKLHLQAAGANPRDEHFEVGKARRRRARRHFASSQGVERGAQLVEGVAARLLDGGERGAGLVGMLVDEVQSDTRLDVDERDVVGQHVMELLGEAQPLLAGPALLLLVFGALTLGQLVAADPGHLGDSQDQCQPSCDQRQMRGAGAAIGSGVDEARHDVPAVAGGRQRPRPAAVPCLDAVKESDHDAQEDRSVRVAEADVDVGGAYRRDDGGEGPPIAQGERSRSEQHEQERDGIDRPPLGLVVRGAEGAHDLDDPDAERADPRRAPRPRSHGGTVGRDRAAVVRPRSQLAMRQPEYCFGAEWAARARNSGFDCGQRGAKRLEVLAETDQETSRHRIVVLHDGQQQTCRGHEADLVGGGSFDGAFEARHDTEVVDQHRKASAPTPPPPVGANGDALERSGPERRLGH